MNRFQGRVFKHPDYVKYLEQAFPEVAFYTEAFKIFWKEGFHPAIGKGGVMKFPSLYTDQAIGRFHVEPTSKPLSPYSSTAECWLRWSQQDEDMFVFPTSNKFLIFCVDENRDACLLGYLDGDDRDAHEVIKDQNYRKNMRTRADSFFRSRGTDPMEESLHDSLFESRWETE